MVRPAALASALLDFALPPRCPGCGAIVEQDHRFCAPCWSALEFLGREGCARCNLPLASDHPSGSLCGTCLADPPRHDRVYAVLGYGDTARRVALKLKYGRQPGLARLIAANLARFVPAEQDKLLLVPVPLHRWRLWSRGYNQAALIATALARRTGCAVERDLLRRTRSTRPLRGMNPGERRRALKGAFALAPGGAERLAGAHVLLVDDVYTSGATANACASVLKRAGAARVDILCWSRVLRDD